MEFLRVSPLLGAVFVVIQLLRKLVIAPRMGIVHFGSVRKTKLMKFTFVMLAINIVAFILGLVATINFGKVPGQMYSITIGLTLLIGFSFAAYILDFSRLFLYGLFVGLSPLIGEWLWTHGYATHHGFPITFGISSGFMILVGVALFLRFLSNNPYPKEGIPSEKV